MGGCGKCAECIYSYEEYGYTECKKDAFVEKSGDGEWDMDVSRSCDYYETYPDDYMIED